MAAEKNTGNTFTQIMAAIRKKQYAPVYLLMGEEPYYIDKIADEIANNVLQPEERDFNQIVLYGLDTSAMQVMDAARALPMMAEHQVVIVREAQMMKDIDKLEKLFKNPTPSTVLVLCYKKEPPKSKNGWIKEADKNGVYFLSKKVYESKVPDFVTNYLSERKISIDKKALAMLVDHIGADLMRLSSELDKLIITLPEGETTISPKFVEEKIGISKDYNPFELRDALINRNVEKANRIVNYFDSNPKAGNVHSLTPQLFTYFQNLMLAFYCPKKNSPRDLAAWLELRNEWAAKDYSTGLRNFTAMKTLQIISMLRSIAARSNGIGNRSADDGQLMRELVYFILH